MAPNGASRPISALHGAAPQRPLCSGSRHQTQSEVRRTNAHRYGFNPSKKAHRLFASSYIDGGTISADAS